MNTKSISKRKWLPVFNKNTHKLFTGYQDHYTAESRDQEHIVHQLFVKPIHMSRGQSSTTLVLKDEDDDHYSMSPKGIMVLVERLINGDIQCHEGWITINVVQVKQGANLAIELVD